MTTPQTKPCWDAEARFSLFQDEKLVGYFRQFKSAYLWRIYLQAQSKDATHYEICHNGIPVNAS